MSNQIYTIEELADHISESLSDEDKREANLKFVLMLHGNMREGGVWGWPAVGEIYKKAGDGFERLL